MSGEQIIVTGASAGIGTEIARTLAQKGHSVIMACRNLQKAQQIRDSLIKDTGNHKIEVLPIDLASIRSILDFFELLKNRGCRIKVLINNAGVIGKNYQITRDGIETTVGVNYVGTYLLTRLLIPLLAEGGRVVNTTSITHRIGRIGDDFFNSDPQSYSRFSVYPDSKLAVLLFSLELSERLISRGVSAYAADPGIVNTDMITMDRWFDPLSDLFFRPFIKSPQKGAETAVHLAVSGEQPAGVLYAGCRPKKIASWITNHPCRKQLWEETEKLVLNRSDAADAEKIQNYFYSNY